MKQLEWCDERFIRDILCNAMKHIVEDISVCKNIQFSTVDVNYFVHTKSFKVYITYSIDGKHGRIEHDDNEGLI